MAVTPSRLVRLHDFMGHSSFITDCKWDESGKYIASCSFDSTVKIWVQEEKKCVYTLKLDSPAYSCCFGPNQYELFTTHSNYTQLWDIRNDKSYLQVFEPQDDEPIQYRHRPSQSQPKKKVKLEFEPIRRYFANNVFNSKVLDKITKVYHTEFTDHDADMSIYSVQMIRSQTNLLTTSRDGTIKLWNIATGKGLATFGKCGFGNTCQPCTLYNDEILLCGTNDGFLNLWEISKRSDLYSQGNWQQRLQKSKWSIQALAIDSIGNILIGHDNGAITHRSIRHISE
jgi:WD40 repeat protein